MAPTCAMFVGSMMMPEPIMFTATMNVSCIRFIRLICCSPCIGRLLLSGLQTSLADDVCVELNLPFLPLLEHALDFVVEARKAVERFLEREKVVEHRLGLVVPPLTWNHDADTRRINQCQR